MNNKHPEFNPYKLIKDIYLSDSFKNFFISRYNYKLYNYAVYYSKHILYFPQRYMLKFLSIYILSRLLSNEIPLPSIFPDIYYPSGIIEDLFKSLATIRIDIKNTGSSTHQIDVISSTDSDIYQHHPGWFCDNTGAGLQIQTAKHEAAIVLNCSGTGKAYFSFKSLDMRDILKRRLENKLDYLYISLFSLSKKCEIFKTINKYSITHDHPFIIDYDVKDGELLLLIVKAKPFDYTFPQLANMISSFYETYYLC